MKDGRSVHLQHPFHGRPDRYTWFGHSTVPARKTGLSCTIERACRPNSPVALFKENISDTDNKVGWVQQRVLQALNPPFRQIQEGVTTGAQTPHGAESNSPPLMDVALLASEP